MVLSCDSACDQLYVTIVWTRKLADDRIKRQNRDGSCSVICTKAFKNIHTRYEAMITFNSFLYSFLQSFLAFVLLFALNFIVCYLFFNL